MENKHKSDSIYLTRCSLMETRYQSDSIVELTKAIIKAQAEFKPLKFNKVGARSSEYVNVSAIRDATDFALRTYGLHIAGTVECNTDGTSVLCIILKHVSGEWMASRAPIRPIVGTNMNEQQSYGSAITYNERYLIPRLLGITASNDDTDDDAQYAKPGSISIITDQQYKTLIDRINAKYENNAKDITKSILKIYKIDDLKNLASINFNKVLELL